MCLFRRLIDSNLTTSGGFITANVCRIFVRYVRSRLNGSIITLHLKSKNIINGEILIKLNRGQISKVKSFPETNGL